MDERHAVFRCRLVVALGVADEPWRAEIVPRDQGAQVRGLVTPGIPPPLEIHEVLPKTAGREEELDVTTLTIADDHQRGQLPHPRNQLAHSEVDVCTVAGDR